MLANGRWDLIRRLKDKKSEIDEISILLYHRMFRLALQVPHLALQFCFVWDVLFFLLPT
jgi:hypothetical protein